MRPQRFAERDACGIGFAADAQGRASRGIVEAALAGLGCLTHRGAVAADARSSDGSGLLVPIPAAVFGAGHGVAVLFVRGDDPRPAFEAAAAAEGLAVVEWRTPPTDDTELGEIARSSQPEIRQAVLAPLDPARNGLEAAAYRLRRRVQATTTGTYVASCSFRTVLYKGLVAADLLGSYFLDLADPAFTAPFAVFHQRFSTNTQPSWERAQPFRTLCHNGEINAIDGNQNRMRARSVLGTEAAGLGPEELFRPVLDADDSDSGQLDSAVELLVRGGRDIRHAVAMLVPEAWEAARELDPEVRGFYRYHACLVEPWDGPAGLVFTDGLGVGAALDRNGLRPLRYAVCEDGLVVCCSEAGAIDVSGRGRVTRGRLGPGQMLFVDPSRGVVLDRECKERLAAGGPYARWSADGLRRMSPGIAVAAPPPADELLARQLAHGYTAEELRMVLKPMAVDAKEPTFSMGDDTPLPSFAGRPRPVHHYLKQRFAQVTNPPIDHLRERLVMSLRTLLGPRRPLLEESPTAARLIALDSFFVYPDTVERLAEEDHADFGAARLNATFPVALGPGGLRSGVDALCHRAEQLVGDGAGLLVIDNGAVSASRAPIPSLLAAGAVHHRLIATGLRSSTSLVVVADDARDVHHLACLLGFGADAVCPRLALASVAAEADSAEDTEMLSQEAQERFHAAAEDGVLKVMSKMGISTVDSYRGAQIFEVIGLGPEVVEVCFAGAPSIVGGLGWDALGADALANHAQVGWPSESTNGARLPNPGYYRDMRKGDYHLHDKDTVVNALQATAAAHLLQKAIKGGRDDLYAEFATLIQDRPPTTLRDLLELVAAGPAVPVDEVEPATAIATRFSTGAMSHGSLSAEAHETLAEAMNLIGGRSNCGEGGEAEHRFHTRGQPSGDKNSRIKQIASGRFGVTPQYCA
ncbi:MAG: glutamate synthase central domain-containing protein, partial [Acidimicrobiales bacterium]